MTYDPRSNHSGVIAGAKTNLHNFELSKKQHAFVLRLTGMMAEATRIGLPITGRALHQAVRAVGWELADDLEKAADCIKAQTHA